MDRQWKNSTAEKVDATARSAWRFRPAAPGVFRFSAIVTPPENSVPNA